MADHVPSLSENHKRSIVPAMRILDQLLCDCKEYARGREHRSVFYQERNSLSPGQRTELLSEIARMWEVMREIRQALGLEAVVDNVARKIWGRSSLLWEVLVETTSKHLRRYGDVPSELAEYLDPRIETLIGLLGNLTLVVGGEPGGQAPPDPASGTTEAPDRAEEDSGGDD